MASDNIKVLGKMEAKRNKVDEKENDWVFGILISIFL